MSEEKEFSESSFKAGMYLLENLTSGMYNDPLSIYREYIQNAVDSIDIGLSEGTINSAIVDITLDPFNKRISIRDNGVGIPAKMAKNILSSIGSSNKHERHLRGFRGIGRLGGIAFSDRATFRTKSYGDKIESVQEWDCLKLRQIINSRQYSLTFKELFDNVTTFSQSNGAQPNHNYFEVILDGVSSFRNHVFDIEKIHNYISQVAPVPFNYESFSNGKIIDQHLSNCLSFHKTYDISLNGNKIYKPYRDVINTSLKNGGGADTIKAINFFEINDRNDQPLGYGWYGLREHLLGAIKKGEKYSGIRVRVGNILIGDSHLLDKCFREERFNSYIIGEIYVDSPQLIPNSRRDDFIDNDVKTHFYNSIEKTVGLPLSKEIRLRSRVMSTPKQSNSHPSERPIAKITANINDDVKDVKKAEASADFKTLQAINIINEIRTKCNKCDKLSNISGIFDY